MKYTVYPSRKYKKQFKKIIESKPSLQKNIFEVLSLLSRDVVLPRKNCDHQLKGSKKHYREYHVSPDILLVYEKKDTELIIHLLEIGSHSELF